MGYYNDRYIIFKSANKESLERLRDFIVNSIWEIAEKEDEESSFSWEALRDYIRPTNKSLVGFDYFLFWPPDCSKEGWVVSNIIDEAVEKVIKYIDEWNYKDESRSVFEKINYFFIFDEEYSDKLELSNRDLILD